VFGACQYLLQSGTGVTCDAFGIHAWSNPANWGVSEYAPTVSSLLEEIDDFLRTNPREFVVIYLENQFLVRSAEKHTWASIVHG
jgi:hypothetical protein